MKKSVVASALCMAIVLSSVTVAEEDKACMLEGSFTMMGVTMNIDDCMENAGLEPAKFKEACKKMSQLGVAMGGAPASITYMSACPLPAQGSCQQLFGKPLNGYYYNRDQGSLTGVKIGCEQRGGTWE